MPITKEEFERYVRVQMSGVYNMIMDASEAALAAGLTLNRYFEIIKNYDECMTKWGKELGV